MFADDLLNIRTILQINESDRNKLIAALDAAKKIEVIDKRQKYRGDDYTIIFVDGVELELAGSENATDDLPTPRESLNAFVLSYLASVNKTSKVSFFFQEEDDSVPYPYMFTGNRRVEVSSAIGSWWCDNLSSLLYIHYNQTA